MKILLVSSSSGSTGGGEIYLRNLALGLSRLGHRVILLCSTNSMMDKLAESVRPYGEVERVEYRNTYDRPARSIGAVLDFETQRRIGYVLQKFRPDVVHINQQVAEDGLDLILAALKHNVPFLTTIHIAPAAEALGARFGKSRDLMTRYVLQRANAVHIAVSECGKKQLIARFNFLSSERLRVVLNGVPFPELDSAKKRDVLTRWGVRSGELVLASVGRLDAQKAPMFALRVIAALRAKGFPIRYVWIGDGSMARAFTEQVRRIGLAEYIIVDGWRDDVADCLQGLDILVMPSLFEGMPLALLEAMGAGLSCCASNVDGMIEAIEDGVTGFLCPPNNFQSWCERLETLIREPKLRVAIGNNARVRAHQRFGLENMALNTIDVYEYVIRRHHCPSLSCLTAS